MKIGVAVVSPVDRGGSLSHPSAILEECCEPLHPIVVNHLFILQHAAVTTVCIDAARARDFDVHEPVFENDGPLSDLETLSLARLDVRRLQLPGTWCTFCPDCLPCPEGIHIPEILRLRNMALAYDMTTTHGHNTGIWMGMDGCGCAGRLLLAKLLPDPLVKRGARERVGDRHADIVRTAVAERQ